MQKGKRSVNYALLPPPLLFCIMIVSGYAIDYSWRIASGAAASWVSTAGILLFFISLYFGTGIVYSLACFGDVPGRVRIALSFTPHLYWFSCQLVLHVQLYTLPEALYLVVNPLFVFFVSWGFFQIGICESLCRRIFRGRLDETRGIQASRFVIGGIAAMAVSLAATVYSWSAYLSLFETLFT